MRDTGSLLPTDTTTLRTAGYLNRYGRKSAGSKFYLPGNNNRRCRIAKNKIGEFTYFI